MLLDGNDLSSPLDFPRGRPALDLAPWHATRPHLVASALGYVRSTRPELSALADRILPRVPRRVLASDTLHTGRASSALALLDDAVEGPWLAWNTIDYTNAITIDVDHDRWPDLAESAIAFYDCPRPLIVYDRSKLTAHLTWFLKTPVRTTHDARPKPVGWLQRIRVGLTAIFEGDGSYTNRLTKNPFSPAWDTLPGGDPAELGDLWRTVTAWCDDRDQPAPKSAFIRPIVAPTEILKGKRVFDVLRYRCYAAGECDRNTIEEWAFEIASDLGSPTSSKNVSKIARSVARYMSTRWTGKRSCTDWLSGKHCDRGVMRLQTTRLSTAEKQSMAGKRTSTLVARKNDDVVQRAFTLLKAAGGRRPTQQQVASEARVSLRTVKRRWKGLTTTAARVPSAVPSGSDPLGVAGKAKPDRFPKTSNPESFLFSEPVIHVMTAADDGKRQVDETIEALEALITVNTESGDDVDGIHSHDGILHRRQRPISEDVRRWNPSPDEIHPPTTTGRKAQRRENAR